MAEMFTTFVATCQASVVVLTNLEFFGASLYSWIVGFIVLDFVFGVVLYTAKQQASYGSTSPHRQYSSSKSSSKSSGA